MALDLMQKQDGDFLVGAFDRFVLKRGGRAALPERRNELPELARVKRARFGVRS